MWQAALRSQRGQSMTRSRRNAICHTRARSLDPAVLRCTHDMPSIREGLKDFGGAR